MSGAEVEPEVSEVSEPELSEEELTEQRLMGEELKRLREARRLTRAELAEQMGGGFTEALIARYETGDAPMEATHIFALMKTLRASQESVEPNHLMAAHLVQSGYGGLTDDRRKAVDLLATALMEDQRKEISRRRIAD